jgi:hypothetical protein
MRTLLLLCSVLSALGVAARPASPPAWRGVWEWSLPKKTEADLIRIADSAHDLGFNALMMYPPAPLIGFMRDQCHQRGIKLYYSTVFSYSKPEWAQVMLPAEVERAKQPLPEDYMYGGKPAHAGEVFTSKLPCYNRPEVREHFRQMVVRYAQLPVDGLAFDAAGYQNYHRCFCPVCEAKLAAYRQAHPTMSEQHAAERVAEETLVSFINEMAAAARQANPQLALTIHIYPWFSPDPYYGQQTDIDVVGQTVSWFFRPHWSLDEVERLTTGLVRDQHRCYPDHMAAPFLGFDARLHRNYRSARRLHQELQIIKRSGAQALHIAELGYLLRKPLIAQAVAEELGGSYRAEQNH